MIFNLLTNEAKSADSQGTYVFLAEATGPVSVTAKMVSGVETSVYLRRAGDQAEFAEPITSIRVQNAATGPQEVSILTGFARYIPAIEGGAVQITGQTAVLEVSAPAPLPVSLAGGPLDVAVQGAVSVTVPAAVAPLAEIVPGLAGTTLPANLDRRRLVLRPGEANVAPVWLSGTVGVGLPLLPDDGFLEIAVTGAVTFIAEDAADKVHVMELTA